MSTDDLTFGYPPARFAPESYRALLAREAPGAPWMVAGPGVDVRPLIPAVVAAGGRVRVGLGDAPLGTGMTNLDWARAAVDLIEAAGGRPAGPAEVRAATASTSEAATGGSA
jgi:3-keto-5-aminohexanoate cleavage enzyme